MSEFMKVYTKYNLQFYYFNNLTIFGENVVLEMGPDLKLDLIC